MALYAFDGTWNDSRAPDEERDQKKDTNVHQFRKLYSKDDGDVEYVDGVGSRHGLVGKYLGGIFGAGAETRIEEQWDALKKRFAAGDEVIDVIGYSRGAAIARMFVHRIGQAYETIIREDGTKLVSVPTVRFLGLYDTVASFGIPWTADEGEFKAEIPSFVESTFHAMALDETRETFGIERCLGDRTKITEVWFRGGHADIGGNASFSNSGVEVANRQRSNITLNWMLAKANAAGLPVPANAPAGDTDPENAPVTVKDDPLPIGNVGSLSRRIYRGDLVHYSVEQTELTRAIAGNLLRRIDVPTRIEDVDLEKSSVAISWNPIGNSNERDNFDITNDHSSLMQLSTLLYPFDVAPARTWNLWLQKWGLANPGIATTLLSSFWAPTDSDKALAWDVYVELATRITTQDLEDGTGIDKTALDSVYRLFGVSRDFMHLHGPGCANVSILLQAYLNEKVRPFTAMWHKKSVEEKWSAESPAINQDFRDQLKSKIQPALRHLCIALGDIACVPIKTPDPSQ